jgi:hypothetical protein
MLWKFYEWNGQRSDTRRSLLFGTQQWTDEGRTYHRNEKVCEQRVRLPSGEIKPVFFDISELTTQAPLADEVREQAAKAALSPVISRRPKRRVGKLEVPLL